MRVRNSGIQFDVFFGAAYKGIPLASALAMAWQQLYGEDIEFAYDRKEPKLHGEVSSYTSLFFSFFFSNTKIRIMLSHLNCHVCRGDSWSDAH